MAMAFASLPRRFVACLVATTALVLTTSVASSASVRGATPIDHRALSKVEAHALAAGMANLAAVIPTGERELQTYTQDDDFQTLLLAAVNEERAKSGLSALCANSKLQAAAQGHSDDMASHNFMGHTGSDGSTLGKRITAQSYKWSRLAENVAAGQRDVVAVMKSWMNSEGHRANIMNAAFTQFGSGYAYNSASTYKHYWTQTFGASSSEACAGASPATAAPAKTTASPAAQRPVQTSVVPAYTSATPASTQTGTSIQAQMLAAVNAERAKVGVSALCINTKLQNAAQGHSNDMARNNYMSHTGSDGSTMGKRISATSYKWSAAAENVAAGQVDVAAVMKSWMNSKGHRVNLLNAKYKHFGMGHAYNSGSKFKHYWTQDFGAGSSEACA